MQNKISFKRLKNFSVSVEENELFTHYSLTDYPFYYDMNYIELHFNPTVEEFQLIEKLLTDYQRAQGQHHLKFLWPADTGVFVDTFAYLNKEIYQLGKLELMHIHPAHFKPTYLNPAVSVLNVTQEYLKAFLKINYEADVVNGEAFAKNKQSFYRYQFDQSDVTFWLAFIEDKPAGSLVVVHSDTFLEIDNVYTAPAFRKMGVASKLMSRVMEIALNDENDVVLLADAEDSPLEMYQKQGFESVSSQIHVLKEF